MLLAATLLRDVHRGVGIALIASNAAAGVWALGAHFVPSLRTRLLWWFIGAAQVLVFVQAGLGVGILRGEDIEPPQFHLLYGFSMIITIGMLYSYKDQMKPHIHLLYAGGSLFMMGLAIRGLFLTN